MHIHERPDRPLLVKCTFERSAKRISFTSARNCTYNLLRDRIEQCFPLCATPYAISYKDDDGEVAEITTESELTEAIQYFQPGNDDAPHSSAASILSGRSFGNRKITLRVQITVEYDGPSLSDSSSLASLDEYRGRNGSQTSFSFSSHHQVEFDDDSVTVSSRDASGAYQNDVSDLSHISSPARPRDRIPQKEVSTSPLDARSSDSSPFMDPEANKTPQHFSDEFHLAAASRYPEDPTALFEHMSFQDVATDDQFSMIDYDPLSGDDRGAAWLRDQNERVMRSMLGALPEPSISDEASVSQKLGIDQGQLGGGDLALRRDHRGKYYYTYTSVGGSSAASQTHDSGYDDGSGASEVVGVKPRRPTKPRPSSMHLNWLATQQIVTRDDPEPNKSYVVPSHNFPTNLTHHSDPIPFSRGYPHIHSEIPLDVLRFLPIQPPHPDLLTDCSDCGVLLDTIRYVCTTCGEKTPLQCRRWEKGKGKFLSTDADSMSYSPSRHSPSASTPPSSSRTAVNEFGSSYDLGIHTQKPLPALPDSSGSSSWSTYVGPSRHGSEVRGGYELCSGCIEHAGVTHAIEVGLAPASSPGRGNSAPSSPEGVSQWMRSAPRQKGQLRHSYVEKSWGHRGWEDVEQDDCATCQCSTCSTIISNKRYKCASCPQMNLCRACYSQVHMIHPTHAFLLVPEKPRRSQSEPDLFPVAHCHINEERSLKHPNVKCAHCMLDIVGARFHCAICESIDICSNCESAGLPGNLDSSDGGHISSHIMIKIPYPVESHEVQTVSRRALHLWTGRDAVNVQRKASRSRTSSVLSSYARTVVGRVEQSPASSQDNHHMPCDSCGKPIIGVRYQCGNCASPESFSLCASCEPSGEPWRLQHSQSCQYYGDGIPYRNPVGPIGSANMSDPREYLTKLYHQSAMCDMCMTRIQGEWFRCAYCGKDLCDSCEELDTHDDTHVFLVFKAAVDFERFGNFADLERPTPVIPYPVY